MSQCRIASSVPVRLHPLPAGRLEQEKGWCICSPPTGGLSGNKTPLLLSCNSSLLHAAAPLAATCLCMCMCMALWLHDNGQQQQQQVGGPATFTLPTPPSITPFQPACQHRQARPTAAAAAVEQPGRRIQLEKNDITCTTAKEEEGQGWGWREPGGRGLRKGDGRGWRGRGQRKQKCDWLLSRCG